jgi:hypothetical protein
MKTEICFSPALFGLSSVLITTFCLLIITMSIFNVQDNVFYAIRLTEAANFVTERILPLISL